jgi:hypothetical protein
MQGGTGFARKLPSLHLPLPVVHRQTDEYANRDDNDLKDSMTKGLLPMLPI